PADPTNPTQFGVHVSSPADNSSGGSPVNYTATATTSCAKGVASMGIYTAPGALAYSTTGATLNTTLSLTPGTYHTVVQEWDNCGGSASATVTVTVTSFSGGSGSGGNSLSGLQKSDGWTGYALLPPDYSICGSCSAGGPEVTWSMEQNVSSPSMSGNATKF